MPTLQRVIAVVGMHRSGTSLVTRALQALGVGLGDNLAVTPASDNAKGHWEDKDILALNERLMAALALRWDLIGAQDDALMEASVLAPLVDEAQALVRAKVAAEELVRTRAAEKPLAWGFKDPRTARLWPFWRRVLVEVEGLAPSFVWVIRHPQAVAHSLMRRNGCSALKASLMWLNHNFVPPVADIANHQHVVVDYERLLNQPQDELHRMSKRLDLAPARKPRIAKFIDDFLDPNLCHHVPADAGAPSLGLQQVAINAYHTLLPVAGDEASLQDTDFLAKWRNLRKAAETFQPVSPLVDAASLAEHSQGQVEKQLRHDVDGINQRVGDGLDKLQRQFADTLHEQAEKYGQRIADAENAQQELEKQLRHDINAVNQRAGQGLDTLQRQFDGTLHEQAEKTGQRLADAENAQQELKKQLRHDINAVNQRAGQGLDKLQRQFADTLHEQAEKTGQRLAEAENAQQELEKQLRHDINAVNQRAGDGLDKLQRQFADTLHEQAEKNGQRLADAENAQQELEKQLRRDINAVNQRAGQGLDTLQRQFDGTLHEQAEKTGQRLADAENAQQELEKQLRRDINAVNQRAGQGLDKLQRQFDGTLHEQAEKTGQRLAEAENAQQELEKQLRHDINAVNQRAGQGLDKLQRQFADTLHEQAEKTGQRLAEAENAQQELEKQLRHDINAVNQRAGDGLDTLQRQFADTLHEQAEKNGQRLADAENAQQELEKQLRHDINAVNQRAGDGLDKLQRQFADTLHEQAEKNGQRLAAAENSQQGLERQLRHDIDGVNQRVGEGLDNLQQQVAASLQEQFAQMSQVAERNAAELRRMLADLAILGELLNTERYTVIKPLLRRAYRLAAAFALRLPAPVQRGLRRLRRLLLPRPVVLRVDIGQPVQDNATPAAAHLAQPAQDSAMPAAIDLGQPSPNRYDVLLCPVIDWHFRFQRPQHLARQLAGLGHRVFYLSTTFAKADVPGFRVLESPAPNVFLVQLRLPGKHPLIYEDLLRGDQHQRLLEATLELVAAAHTNCLVALVDLPFWKPLAEALPGCLVVYDCMDHHAGFSTNSSKMIEEEDALLDCADLVVTTSAQLSAKIRAHRDNTLIRNAGEIHYFREAPNELVYVSKRPVVGYLGAIAEWFDMALVVNAARRRSEWDFVLVGDVTGCDPSEAAKQPNIKLVGEVPYAQAASWVHSFDVALIPFRITELTRCTNPVKAYEYLAAGKPVVATALPEVELMDGMIHVAESRERFMELLDVAMDESDDASLAARRAQWAGAHDWRARGQQLDEAIKAAFPKVSVIVLAYNNLAFTQACLHSLEINTHYPDWELIVVDNGSTDGSGAYLSDYAADHPRVKLVRNGENLGFAAGNNRGLQVADGEHLIILNNDTYVTPGWMLGLVRHLRRDPQLGLLGPVTNNIGNEAKIDIHYADMEEMQRAASAYTASHARQLLDAPVVAFFCAAMPRSIYQALGGLDERFGLGFFEDDDYCQRVRQAGFKVAIAEDVFIHHHLSATFDQLDTERRQALFERNKAIYEDKWGPWTPHRYRD